MKVAGIDSGAAEGDPNSKILSRLGIDPKDLEVATPPPETPPPRKVVRRTFGPGVDQVFPIITAKTVEQAAPETPAERRGQRQHMVEHRLHLGGTNPQGRVPDRGRDRF